MKTIEIKTQPGRWLSDVFDEAKQTAIGTGCIVMFTFNGLKCHVSKDCNFTHFEQQYEIAHLFNLKSIGFGHTIKATKKEIKIKTIEKEIQSSYDDIDYHRKRIYELKIELEKLK